MNHHSDITDPTLDPQPAVSRWRRGARGLAAAGALGVGALGIAALNPLGSAGALQEAGDTTEQVDDADETGEEGRRHRPGARLLGTALEQLVEDGTLTQAQADAVVAKVQELAPDRPGGPGGHHGPKGRLIGGFASAAAEAIGVEPEELRDALEEGQSVAEVAEENGVEPQEVIDAIVAAVSAELDEKVAAGDLDAERAEEMKERLAEAAARFVEFTR